MDREATLWRNVLIVTISYQCVRISPTPPRITKNSERMIYYIGTNSFVDEFTCTNALGTGIEDAPDPSDFGYSETLPKDTTWVIDLLTIEIEEFAAFMMVFKHRIDIVNAVCIGDLKKLWNSYTNWTTHLITTLGESETGAKLEVKDVSKTLMSDKNQCRHFIKMMYGIMITRARTSLNLFMLRGADESWVVSISQLPVTMPNSSVMTVMNESVGEIKDMVGHQNRYIDAVSTLLKAKHNTVLLT